jgi:D-alanyl-D-alanine carboxypeptidase/D-alanyl-D-alanine-endopeptidase (penicillin-binding protein 4)
MRRTPALLIAICVVFLPATAEARAANAPFCPALKAQLVRGGGDASGLLVVDLGSGRVVCRRAATTARPLASNIKLFTTGTALASFGPKHRIATRVLAAGRLGADGVLHGDLYLKGGGDPSLGSPPFYNRFLGGLGTDIFGLKPQIRAAGIDSVTGRLYADDTIFDRLRGVADSGYATSPYVGPLSGLAFDSGYADLRARHFASDPAKLAATTLARSLRRAGVHIRAQVALGEAPPAARQVAAVRSPAMTRIVNTTDVYSDNFFAETLIKLLGARFGAGGSTQAGAAVVEHFARSHGSGVRAIDGSGLTRSGRASPSQVVALLEAMRGSAVGVDFIEDLALAGREGTVASRMHGTRAAGRCRTKTGTLTGVSNLSGYCFNRSGKAMAFSILMGSVHNLTLAHQEQDRIAGAVASS